MKNFLSMIALAAILMVPIMSAYGQGVGSSSQPIQGSVTINALTCGISANPASGGGGISYGSINPGTVANADQSIRITNNGNTPTTSVTVAAGDWVTAGAVGSIVEHIKAENTAFTLDANLVAGTFHPLSPTSLIGGTTTYGITPVTSTLSGSGSLDTYWQLNAVLDNTPFSGQLTQTMTFTSGC